MPDDGPEFISLAIDHWAYINRVTLDFSGPGKPSFQSDFTECVLGAIWPGAPPAHA